jgi:hypothetical protein
MGTSSARRAPTMWLWRRAKGTATRYLAPEGEAGLEAREVVSRYLAALGEGSDPGSQDLLAGFRLTRKVGQDLGAFAEEAATQGWEAALGAWGLSGVSGPSGETAAAVWAGSLMESGGGLEDAVARSSLAAVLEDFRDSEQVDPAQVVRRFLSESIYQRLVLDLGESLEAASRSYGRWRQGMEGLRGWISGAGAMEGPEEPPPPEQWRGLAGWHWLTLALENLLRHLQECHSERSKA